LQCTISLLHLGRKLPQGEVLSETSREAFGQAIPPKSLQDEIDKDSRFGRQERRQNSALIPGEVSTAVAAPPSSVMNLRRVIDAIIR
jgi:hypothetical protein